MAHIACICDAYAYVYDARATPLTIITPQIAP